jgi:DNA-nicking Smr family endonuclease
LTYKRKKRDRGRIAAPRFEESQDQLELLEEELAGVTPLRVKKTVPRLNGSRLRSRFRNSEKDENRVLLQNFISGKSAFDWVFHPEYRQGGPQEKNRTLIRKLRRGQYSIQAQLDLHGMTQVEALEALENFLSDCSRKNLLCVRIIHGKGNNSVGNQGVLRRRVPQWLGTRRLSRWIVAFTSATPKDGGIGATYVLLRKTP